MKGDESGFVLLFDESLNAELQKKQLDFHLRSWDHDRVVSRYFGSSFMGHASADDLMEKFDLLKKHLYIFLTQLMYDC